MYFSITTIEHKESVKTFIKASVSGREQTDSKLVNVQNAKKPMLLGVASESEHNF